MDNYLNYRWPKGPGVQPPPMPDLSSQPVPRRAPRRRTARQWAVSAVCVVLVLALLGSISFWAVNGLANLLADADFSGGGSGRDPGAHRTFPVPSGGEEESDWSLDDLPWGDPDPEVQLSVEPAQGNVLSGRDIHTKVLPSIVYVEAQGGGGLNRSLYAGTGIVVTATGYVLTNFHIIEDTSKVQVMLVDDQTTYYDAQVIGVDEEFDLAVLKFDGEGLGLAPARLGDSDALAVGDRVYAEGNPMGYLLGSMSAGIVSALDRDDEVDGGGMVMIQTDTPLNPGNSGGALVNEYGQVVGITSAKITGLVTERNEAIEDAAVIENIGLALPMSDILPFVNRMIATGKSWRPSIGITCSQAVEDGRQGIKVAEVEEDAPAFAAGLQPDDLIISANGERVTDLAGLRRMIYRTGADEQLHCVVVRDGEELTISFGLIDKLEG
jgi:S1-C subfamily serine protease